MLCCCRSGTSRENRIARAAPDRSADRAAAPAILRASSRPDMLCAWAMPVPFFFPVRRQKTVISLSKGRGQCELVLAAHPASELCEQQQRTDFCLPHRMIPKSGVRFSDQIMRNKGRSAERRIQPWPCHKRGTAARQADGPAQVCVRRSPALPGRARLPALHRGTSPTARLISGPRFLELPGANGRTLPGASAASTSRAGHSAGRYDARNRPGAECVVPPAGTAPAPPSGAPSRKASLNDSMSEMADL
jgi:hypothetical protein